MTNARQTADEAEGADAPEDDKPMSFWDHLEELRVRLVRATLALLVGCAVAWNFKEKILAVIAQPFNDAWPKDKFPNGVQLHFASPGDIFLSYFNLSLIGGAALAAPIIFYQLWSFVAPGLYAREKRYVLPFVFASSALFVGGGYFGYLSAFPVTFGYFLSLAGDVEGVVTVVPTVMMEDYITFVMKMLLGFGLIFEIPILFTALARIGVVNHKMLIKYVRHYIFAAFVVAAVLTPPDWASQLIMAIPACLLYVVSIGLVYVFERREALEAWESEQREAAKLAET
jgi:sec-independent protein translocase protein TatC